MINLPFIQEGAQISDFGNGLINKSWKVEFPEAGTRAWLLQKINSNIFKDVEGLTSNIIKVTAHIRKKLELAGKLDIDRRVLTPVVVNQDSSNETGKYYYKDTEGDFWRAFLFIEDSFSYEMMETPQLAETAGKAFGSFHKMLNDFPGEALCEVLPGFHYTPGRIENLRKRVNANPVGRLKECAELANGLLSRGEEFSAIAKMGERGELPLRVVHQDTKLNNVLFDARVGKENPEMLCIVDLDTVMPGFMCYDVGDAIRTGANRAAEDEKDLSKVALNPEIYKAFIKGFLSEVKDFLTEAEYSTIPFGPKLLAYEQAVRFLDDYLAGDIYYKIEYAEHNLVRAKAQAKLLESMDELI